MHKLPIFLFLLLPQIVFAEVSDKIASISLMWMDGLVFGVIGLTLAYKKWWLVFLGILVSLVFISAAYDLETDQYLKEAILREQGVTYFIHAYVSAALIMALSVIGLWYGRKKQANKST
jgi:putative exporter of polyketide antibiotics